MEQKILNFLEAIFGIGIFLFASAMDSQNTELPAIGFITSIIGMFIVNFIREKKNGNEGIF